MRCYRH